MGDEKKQKGVNKGSRGTSSPNKPVNVVPKQSCGVDIPKTPTDCPKWFLEGLERLEKTIVENITNSFDTKLTNNIGKLQKSMNEQFEAMQETITTLTSENEKLVLENTNLKKRVVELEDSKCFLNHEIKKNTIQANNLEQNSRKYCLIFKNINVTNTSSNEECHHKVLKILQKVLKMDIDEDSIAACHVLPVINKNDNGEENQNKKKQSPGIIIRFVYLNIVDSIYQRKKNLSKMTDDEKVDFDIITGKNCIVRPCLTKQNLELLGQCHEVFKSQNPNIYFKYVWADCRGTIKVRETSTSKVIIINSTDDILRIDPRANVNKRILCK